MKLNSRILLSTAGLAALSLSLSACTGAPAPCTEPLSNDSAQESKQTQEAVPTDATPTVVPASSSSGVKALSAKSSSSQSTKDASTKAKTETQSATKTQSSSSSTDYTLTVIDPYIAFPAMANEVFEHADSLYRQGNIDGAVNYLQRFRVIKPLWNQWETKADSMLLEFGKSNTERAKQFEPLVLEIQNMNRAHAAYSLVAQVADSLISLAPGDSLEQFANRQKQLAYKNTLDKGSKEKAAILKLATDQAQFAEAEKKAIEFQMRYRDFEEPLQIQAMIDDIRKMAQENNAEAAAYWKKNDPAAALEKSDKLINDGKYAEAKELLNKLKASPLRKQAIDKYNTLADSFCNAQRKTTSQLFKKAQGQSDTKKKEALLNEAIASLDKCLDEYPDYSQKAKVIDNKKFLQKELGK